MALINPFEDDNAFNMISLTDAINLLPNNYGKLKELNLFAEQPIATRMFMIDVMEGVLNLIPQLPVGSPGHGNKGPSRKAIPFATSHYPVDDVLLPEEYDSIRAFGTENQLTPLVQILNQKLASIKAKHDITAEYQRWGALKGIVLDASGSTIYNYFTSMDTTQKAVNFVLATATTKIRNKVMEAKRHIEKNLKGEMITGYMCLASSSFMDAFTEHALVKAAYDNYQESSDRLGGDVRRGFMYGGVMFEEHVGEATYYDSDDGSSTTRKFIADGEGYIFPIGTQNTFKTVYSPGDFIETANTLGMPYYAKQEARKFNRGIDIHTQSNPLSVNKRPELTVKITAS